MSKDQEIIEVMARHYIIAALWADAEDGTNPKPTKQAMEAAKRDCLAFCELAGPELLREVLRRHAEGYGKHPDCGNAHPVFAAMGHDFWLTRNGHGTGFWDRSELEANDIGDKLTAIAKQFREANCEQYRGWFYVY